MTTLRSPLSYQGSKYSLVKHLRKLIQDDYVLCDVFGGGGVVSMNMTDKFETVIHNDHDCRVSDILHTLSFLGYDEVVAQATDIIKEYRLTKTNEHGYYRLVRYWNETYSDPDKSIVRGSLMLWVISKCAFSSLMRFNSSGEFNYSFGKRALSEAYLNRDSFRKSIEALDKLDYLTFDWRNLLHEDKMTYYLDPPYLASGDNIYKGHWDENEEQDFLDTLANVKGPWYLSNVLSYGHHENKLLKKFARHYTVYELDKKYNLRRGTSTALDNVEEVLITNVK